MPSILVVEDDASHRRFLEIALTARGFQVTPAGDGRQAREAAETGHHDLVLLDLGLPDIDGVELCRQLHVWPAVPIIIVSADADDERIVAALGVGADDYVVKPVSPEVLVARIGVQLRHAAVAAPVLISDVLGVGDVRLDSTAHAGRRRRLADRAQRRPVHDPADPDAQRRHAGDAPGAGAALGRGSDEPDRNAVRINVSRLRQRLGVGPERPQLLTERRVGYRLVPPGA